LLLRFLLYYYYYFNDDFIEFDKYIFIFILYTHPYYENSKTIIEYFQIPELFLQIIITINNAVYTVLLINDFNIQCILLSTVR